MTRAKLDAIQELSALQRKIAGNRRSIETNPKTESVEIAERGNRALMKLAAALLAEIPTLPDRAALTFAHTDGNFPCLTRTSLLAQDELDALEIPAFLRRDASNRLAA